MILYNLTVTLQPSSDGTHVGLVKFGYIASTQWDLNRFDANSLDLLSSINAVQISYDGGLSNMADAFNVMRTEVMSPSGGGSRVGVQNVCIMITANKADINETDFLPQANQLKALCRLIIIGVGPNATDATSDAYFQPAVTNSSTDFIKVPTFPQLTYYVTTVFNLLCSTSSISTSATTVNDVLTPISPPNTSPSIKTANNATRSTLSTNGAVSRPTSTTTALPANDATTGSTTTLETNVAITTSSSSGHTKHGVVDITTSLVFGFFLLLSQLF